LIVYQSGVVVAVSDAVGNTLFLGYAKNEPTVVMDMAMDHIIRSVFAQNLAEISRVLQGIGGRRAWVNFRTERFYFVVIGAAPLNVDSEIHLKSLAIYMPEHVHEPGFHAATIHSA
jgi:hypothetical protein